MVVNTCSFKDGRGTGFNTFSMPVSICSLKNGYFALSGHDVTSQTSAFFLYIVALSAVMALIINKSFLHLLRSRCVANSTCKYFIIMQETIMYAAFQPMYAIYCLVS